MDDAFKKALQKAFINIASTEAGKKVIAIYSHEGYQEAQPSDYDNERAALARTLAQNPQIILADEPVASLDPVTAKQVMTDFKRINREMHISVLINIHHVDLALQYADRVIGICEGKIVFDGSADSVTDGVLDKIYRGKLEEAV